MAITDENSALIETMRTRMDELNQRTLFVSRLPKDFHLKTVSTLFKKSVNARFPKKKFKGNRKYVFVEFATAPDAKTALTKASDLKIEGKPVKAELSSQRVTDGPWPAPESYKLGDFRHQSLHVACLPRATTEEDLKQLFPDAKSVDLPHAGPGKTLGYAEINFTSKEAARAAFGKTHGTELHGSPIVVNFSIKTQAGKLKHKSTDKASKKKMSAKKSELKKTPKGVVKKAPLTPQPSKASEPAKPKTPVATQQLTVGTPLKIDINRKRRLSEDMGASEGAAGAVGTPLKQTTPKSAKRVIAAASVVASPSPNPSSAKKRRRSSVGKVKTPQAVK